MWHRGYQFTNVDGINFHVTKKTAKIFKEIIIEAIIYG